MKSRPNNMQHAQRLLVQKKKKKKKIIKFSKYSAMCLIMFLDYGDQILLENGVRTLFFQA